MGEGDVTPFVRKTRKSTRTVKIARREESSWRATGAHIGTRRRRKYAHYVGHDASSISSFRKSGITSSLQIDLLLRPSMRPGERTHHLNMSIMPLVNPLVIAPSHLPSFTNHCAVYMCLANANAKPVRPPSRAILHPPRWPPAALCSLYTHHCQCTISSLFIGPAQRSPLIIARNAGPGARAHNLAHGCACCLRHSQKQRGYCQVDKLNHSRGERACKPAISCQPLFWLTQ